MEEAAGCLVREVVPLLLAEEVEPGIAVRGMERSDSQEERLKVARCKGKHQEGEHEVRSLVLNPGEEQKGRTDWQQMKEAEALGQPWADRPKVTAYEEEQGLWEAEPVDWPLCVVRMHLEEEGCCLVAQGRAMSQAQHLGCFAWQEGAC